MAKISELDTLAGASIDADADWLALADASADQTKKVSVTGIRTKMGLLATDSPTFVAVTAPTVTAATLVAAGAVTATGSIKSSSATGGVGYATGAGGAVTQLTNAATAVTLNKVCGQITTVALTTAAGAEEEFVVANNTVGAADVVAVGTTYAGAGTPAVTVKNISTSGFSIVITNLHAANALNAVVVVNFVVLKGVAA